MKHFFKFISLLLLFASLSCKPSDGDKIKQELPVYHTQESMQYADSIIDSLSVQQKITQLFMLDVHPSKGERHLEQMEDYIRQFEPGGIVVFKSSLEQLQSAIKRLQAASKIPLLVAIDGEWGLNMRVPDVSKFPYNMTLGAVQDNELIYQMSSLMAKRFKKVGVHVNFAPVVDINNNAQNPVIGFRSFSDNKINVAQKGIAYMKGLQDNNVLAVAKHFPGHGNTSVDSHKSLPVIQHSKDSIVRFELYPFEVLIRANVGGVMVGHLSVPRIDSTGVPASLSYEMMTNLLKKKMNYKGILFSDAMNMGGIVNDYEQGEKLALKAGMDVIEYPFDTEMAIADIQTAIDSAEFDSTAINQSVRKVLMLKQWAGLTQKESIKSSSFASLNEQADSINLKLFAASTTLLKSNKTFIPIQKHESVAYILLGAKAHQLQAQLKKLSDKLTVFTGLKFRKSHLNQLLKKYDKLVVSLHNTSLRRTKNYKVSVSDRKILSYMASKPNVLISLYSNPYLLNVIPGIEKAENMIQAYQETPQAYTAVFNILNGTLKPKGKLAFTVNKNFQYGMGVTK